MAHHNKLLDRVTDLSGKVFTPLKRHKAKPARTTGLTNQYNATPLETTEQKGDLLIQYICHNETNSVHDMGVIDIDSKSHSEKPQEKCLQEAKRAKNCMYLEACLQQRRHFSPCVASVYGLLGVEETATLSQQSGGDPTHGHVDTSKVGLPSLWCRPHTGVSRVTVCRCIG